MNDDSPITRLQKRSKICLSRFLSKEFIEFTFGKLNLFWRIHISADLNNLLDGWLGVACAIIKRLTGVVGQTDPLRRTEIDPRSRGKL